MAVVFDTVATNTAADTSASLTINITAAASACAVVGVGWRQGVTPTVSGMGGTWSALGSIVINSARVVLWGAPTVSSGAQTATISWSDTFGQDVAAYVATFTGMHATPFGDYTSATGASTAPSVTVPNAVSGDYVVDIMGHGSGGTTTIGANQTALYNADQAVISVAGSRQLGADGGVMSWTEQFSDNWAIAGVRIIQAAGGASAFPTPIYKAMMLA